MKRFRCLLVLAVVGCQLWEPSGGSRQPRPMVASTSGPIRPGVIAINPSNATIEFTGSTAIMSQTGHFEGFTGTLELPTADPKDARIHVAIDLETTTTGVKLLTKHLKGDDFFDVAKYPTAEFTTEKIAPTGEGGIYQVTGQMSFHGVQRGITFPAHIVMSADEIAFDATLAIRQTEFGMAEGAKKTKDEVPVKISVRARTK